MNLYKKIFYFLYLGIDEEFSDEYDDNMIVDVMLFYLKIGKLLNKKISLFVDRFSLFNRDKKYLFDYDDDSISYDIEYEEIDKVFVGIKCLFYNKKMKIYLSL